MFCNKCGNEVDEKAVTCPQCGVSLNKKKAKKPIFKKWWFWAIVCVAVIAIASSSSGEDKVPAGADTNSTVSQNIIDSTDDGKAGQDAITYEKIDLQTMLDELDQNALKAEKTYQNKYVEVVGSITNFDSDGSYISIEPVNADEWNFDTVMCKIKNDEQLNYLLDKVVGDQVTVKGQITSIGEVLGYTINMIEVQ